MYDVIETKDLTFNYKDKELFKNLSLSIKSGSFTTIMGNNQIGKTTLSKLFSGIIRTKSYLKIDKMFVNPKNIKEIRKRVVLVSENNDNIFVCNTVKEQIEFYLKTKGIKKENIEKKITDFIHNLGFDYILELPPSKLSGGENQLLAIFLAIASNPKILIIDDGLTMLDSDTKNKIFLLLKHLNKKGLTIINFTHDSEEILKGTDVILINNSDIVLNSKVKDAFNDVKIFTDNKIKLPFVVDLSIKLRYYKVIDKIYFDTKKLVNDLWE